MLNSIWQTTYQKPINIAPFVNQTYVIYVSFIVKISNVNANEASAFKYIPVFWHRRNININQ